LYLGEFYPPHLIALLGALGTATAHFCEYHAVVHFLKQGKLKRLKKIEKLASIPQKLKNHLFWALLVGGATGMVPSDLLRLLAMLTRYNPYISWVAIFVGRYFRYFCFAYLGMHFQLPLSYILAIFVLLLLWGFYRWQKRWNIRKSCGISRKD